MGFVDIQRSAVAFGQAHQRRQVGAVAVHAEHGFGEDQFAAGVLPQQVVEMLEIVVAEDLRLRAGDPAAMHDAGVVQRIAENRRRICRVAGADFSVGAAHDASQRRDHRGIGLETAGEKQCGLAAFEGRQLFLHRQGDLARAGDQARSRRAGTVALRPFRGAGRHQRMPGEAQIVVG